MIHEPFPFRRIPPPPLARYDLIVWTADRRWIAGPPARVGDGSVRLTLGDGRSVPFDAPARPLARISGQVRFAGAPLVDAEVAAPGIDIDGIVAGPDVTHTRRDGTFELVLARDHLFERQRRSGPTTIELRVRHDAGPMNTTRLVPIAPGQHVAHLVIDIPAPDRRPANFVRRRR